MLERGQGVVGRNFRRHLGISGISAVIPPPVGRWLVLGRRRRRSLARGLLNRGLRAGRVGPVDRGGAWCAGRLGGRFGRLLHNGGPLLRHHRRGHGRRVVAVVLVVAGFLRYRFPLPVHDVLEVRRRVEAGAAVVQAFGHGHDHRLREPLLAGTHRGLAPHGHGVPDPGRFGVPLVLAGIAALLLGFLERLDGRLVALTARPGAMHVRPGQHLEHLASTLQLGVHVGEDGFLPALGWVPPLNVPQVRVGAVFVGELVPVPHHVAVDALYVRVLVGEMQVAAIPDDQLHVGADGLPLAVDVLPNLKRDQVGVLKRGVGLQPHSRARHEGADQGRDRALRQLGRLLHGDAEGGHHAVWRQMLGQSPGDDRLKLVVLPQVLDLRDLGQRDELGGGGGGGRSCGQVGHGSERLRGGGVGLNGKPDFKGGVGVDQRGVRSFDGLAAENFVRLPEFG